MSDKELNRRIAERAYFLYLERGKIHGHDRDDWIRAEKEIRDERKPRRTKKASSSGTQKRTSAAKKGTSKAAKRVSAVKKSASKTKSAKKKK